MIVIASLLTFVLGFIAMTHFHWAMGGHWPASDEAALARAAVGTPGVARMPPPGASMAVGLCLAIAALLPQMLTGGRLAGLLPPAVLAVVTELCITIFALRGVAGFTNWWRSRFPEQPFATYDRRYYSPLCLFVASGYAVLLFAR